MNAITQVSPTPIDLIRNARQEMVTPCYVYSVSQIVNNYETLKRELGTPLIVSIKANHCPELLARLGHAFVDGYEVATLGELRLRAGAKSRIYVNTPAYTSKVIEAASRYNAIFIIDHYEQLALIAEIHAKKPITNELLLRLNFDSFAGTKGKSSDHFGMDEAGLVKAIELSKKIGLKVKGFHIFGGSSNFAKRSQKIVDIAEQLFDRVSNLLGYPCELINLGGGVPANWRDLDLDFASYRKNVERLQGKAEVVHESGRALFASAGYFVTEVVSKKSINGHHYAVCDGGIAQNFMLSKTEHVIRKYEAPVLLTDSLLSEPRSYTFVGSSCNRDDVIGEVSNTYKDLQVGDRIVFGHCGAYNATYTVSRFLALPETRDYII